MNSPLLALFIRSLREDTRLKLTYFARVGLVTVILLFMFSVEAERGWSNGPGLSFFSMVIVIDCVFIVLAGCGWFASAITEEKEEMTLGLLRMTNLNPLSILLGKGTSRLCGALLLLAAQIPFTVLAITLGGISLGQIAAAYCTLGTFLIFLANLALLCSVLCKRTTGAAAMTVVALVFFFGVVPLLNWIAHLPAKLGIIATDAAWVAVLDHLADLALVASPFYRLTQILETGFSEGPFGWQAGSNLALGAGCFLLAWLVFDAFCDERQETGPRRSGTLRRRRFLSGLRAGRTWKRALAWKDFYFLAGGKIWITGKFILYGLLLTGLLYLGSTLGAGPRRLEFQGFFTMWIMALIFSLELAFCAASIFKVERQARTLSTLAVLPMSLQRIALQKIMGVLPALVPAVSYFFIGFVCAAQYFFKDLDLSDSSMRVNLTVLIGFGYTLAQGIFFLYLTANLSLRIKRGALPLAIGIQFVLQFFLSLVSFATPAHDEWAFAPLIILSIFATVFLHHDIFKRLENLAADE